MEIETKIRQVVEGIIPYDMRYKCIICGKSTKNRFTNIAQGIDIPCCSHCKVTLADDLRTIYGEI